MRIFLTGATGFIGAAIVPELIKAGHHVIGMTRSDAGAQALINAGINPRDILILLRRIAKRTSLRSPHSAPRSPAPIAL